MEMKRLWKLLKPKILRRTETKMLIVKLSTLKNFFWFDVRNFHILFICYNAGYQTIKDYLYLSQTILFHLQYDNPVYE